MTTPTSADDKPTLVQMMGWVAGAAQLRNELEIAQGDLTTALALLRRLEWAGGDAQAPASYCPICSGFQPDGHAPDCELAALLTAHPAGEGG